MAWTYILECGDASYYVGSTTDLDRRLDEHTQGLGAAYTARRQPVRLLWCQEFARVDEAYAMEKKIQGWSRAKRQALIDGRFGALPGLSRKSFGERSGDDGGRFRAVE